MNRVDSLSNHISEGSPPLVITLIGGGNSGHVCASLIHENTKGRVKVQLYTSKPDIWSTTPTVTFPDGSSQTGLISKISSDAREVFPNADIVLWTGPVSATKQVFENLRAHIDPAKTVVGTLFAQGLTHLLAHRIFGEDMKFFALRNIPWVCRTVKPGQQCEIFGAKTSIECVAVNLSEGWIKHNLEPLFIVQKMGLNEPKIVLMDDFCPIVFNPANQIIHPARYWGLFRNWVPGGFLSGDNEPSEWLYRGMDELSGNILQALEEELQAIKQAYYKVTGCSSCLGVLPLRERLLIQYGDQIKDKSTMATMVGTNQAYSMAKTPVIRTNQGVAPNPNHRVVVDDIGWGLCVLVSIAERLGVATTVMNMMIEWHQRMMGKEFLVNSKLVGRDCQDLVLLGRDEPLEYVAHVPSRGNRTSSLREAESLADEDRIGNP